MANKPRQIENWLIARVFLLRVDAHQILGIPHYIETDRFVEQQGLEDHWVFAADQPVKVRLVYRNRMETLEVFSDPPNFEFVKVSFPQLFESNDFEIVEPPERFASP